jgi:hypothetical protein
LPPLRTREYSVRRDRRQKQFGVVGVAGFLVAETARFFGEREDARALLALSAAAVLVAHLALGAVLWSTAWVYGDEVESS